MFADGSALPGRKEGTAPRSDVSSLACSSPLWTDELRQQLNFPARKAKDDGKFWIAMKDVTPFLQAFYINHYQPGWKFVCAVDDTLPIGQEIPEPVCAIIEVKESENPDPWCDMWLTLQVWTRKPPCAICPGPYPRPKLPYLIRHRTAAVGLTHAILPSAMQFYCESSQEMPAIAMALFRRSEEDGLFRPFAESKYVKFTSVDLELDVRPCCNSSRTLSAPAACAMHFILVLCRSCDRGGSVTCLPSGPQRTPLYDGQAHPGIYLATLRVDAPDGMEPGDGAVVLNSYSEWPINLQLAPDWPRIWAKMVPSIRAITLEQGEAQTYEKYGAPEIKVTSWQSATLGIACVVYDNGGESQFQLKEDLGFQLSNLVLLKGEGESAEPADDQESCSLLLAPGESQMLIFRTQDVQKPFSLSYSRSFALQGA